MCDLSLILYICIEPSYYALYLDCNLPLTVVSEKPLIKEKYDWKKSKYVPDSPEKYSVKNILSKTRKNWYRGKDFRVESSGYFVLDLGCMKDINELLCKNEGFYDCMYPFGVC